MAYAEMSVPIAMPLLTLNVDGTEISELKKIIKDKSIDTVVVGYPRNQKGDATAQTKTSEDFADRIEEFAKVVLQDESLTSVMAEDRLKAGGKPYDKAEVDSLAAAIILQDYISRLERQGA
mgnify:CR=1 FL=1